MKRRTNEDLSHHLTVLKEMQKWRRGLAPYDKIPSDMPYTPKEYGLSLDVAIELLESKVNKRNTRV